MYNSNMSANTVCTVSLMYSTIYIQNLTSCLALVFDGMYNLNQYGIFTAGWPQARHEDYNQICKLRATGAGRLCEGPKHVQVCKCVITIHEE